MIQKERSELRLSNPILLIGEIHGTKETPRFAFEILKGYDTVCVEVPSNQQHFFDNNQIADSPFFNRTIEDGKSTKEYLALYQSLQAAGVKLVCVGCSSFWQLLRREKTLTRNILGAKNNKTAALLGGIHAATTPMWIGLLRIRPAGYRLRKKGVRVHSFMLAPTTGSFLNVSVKPIDSFNYERYYDKVADIGTVSPATLN